MHGFTDIDFINDNCVKDGEMGIPSILSVRMKMSVKLNGVIISVHECIESLQRFCRPVIFFNIDEEFETSLAGSSFQVWTRNGGYKICTNHQLENHFRNPQEIILIVNGEDGRKKGLTPNGSGRINPITDETKNLDDLLIAYYQPDRPGLDMATNFLRMDLDNTPHLGEIEDAEIFLIFAIGYPTKSSDYEAAYDEAGNLLNVEVVSRWSKVFLERASRSTWDTENRIPLSLHHSYQSDIGDYDGYSGAPVFFLFKDGTSQLHLGFAGLLTHGNQRRRRFAMYDAKYVRQAVQLFDEKPFEE